jgi:ABC-type multidrug transport system fused ATPase/permease subunit
MAVPSTEAIFEDGETHKDIEIRVIPCESFDGTIEFGLYIEQDSGVNCAIGKYLHTATVKIIDLSSFPTNKLQRFVKGGDSKKIQSIPPIELIRSFLEMCWRIPEVREGSKKIIISEQFHSLYAIGLVFIMYSVVSTLTSSRSSGEKMDNLTLLAAGWIFPVCIKHYLDYAKQFWKVGGTMRSKLQLLLLKKFLNYTDDSRCHVEIETLLMAMVRDVSECVSEGYLAALDLFFGSGIKIGMLVLAMLILQVISTGTMVLEVETALPLIVVCCLPVPIFVFLTLRQANYFKLRDEVFKNENKGIDHVISSVLNYDLVSAYDKRTEQLMEYAKKLQTLNAAINSLNSSVVNSSYFVPWLIALIVGGYIWYGGYQVVQFEEENGTKGLELAQFLSTIGIIRALGEEFTTAYGQVLRITGAYCNIRAVTVFLNLPVDVPQRLQVSRQRRILGKQLRAELRKSIRLGKVEPLSLHDVPADRMKIVMNDANFSYVDKGGFDEGDKEAQSSDTKTKNKKKPKNKKNSSIIPERRISAKIANMYMGISEIEQGKVVTIIGAKSQGKATIMRLIAGHLFPEVEDSNDSVYGRCSLFIPPHRKCTKQRIFAYTQAVNVIAPSFLYRTQCSSCRSSIRESDHIQPIRLQESCLWYQTVT